ncbi:hypothetical protein [Halobacillus sp. A5]|uniref:hypothetical protein n=1 Tax=Halobacillus sp. A5 TaxID=2880263 RepID=UPI0020A637CF|nr:hypothetical protein [Halobacillus sp. A5]MCP3028029.1 hypothetical protein [Halobacillus sp. A5]
MANKSLPILIILSLFLTGCMSGIVDTETVSREKENTDSTNESTAQLIGGEWKISKDLEAELAEALNKNPYEATEEELYEVLKDESLRQQYLEELYALLDLKVEDGLISVEEADAQKETMEFIFEEK